MEAVPDRDKRKGKRRLKMTTISTTLLRVAALAALTTAFGMAQNLGSVQGTIPFDFVAAGKTLPAGYYTITSDMRCSCLVVRDARAQVKVVLLGVDADHPANPKASQLAFRVYGERHYLASIWNGSSGAGRQFNKTPAEREAEIAAVPQRTTLVLAQK
jgi:hypothetical protein